MRTPGVTALGLGAMIGAGIFVLTGMAAGKAGPALILAFALNGAVALIVGACYAELATMMPKAGGAYVWAKAGLGNCFGFFAGLDEERQFMSAALDVVKGVAARPGIDRQLRLAAHAVDAVNRKLPQLALGADKADFQSALGHDLCDLCQVDGLVKQHALADFDRLLVGLVI